MKLKKTALSVAVLVTLGLGGMAVGPVASAAVIANGNYVATINVTPLKYNTTNGVVTATLPKAGTDGAWNSTFSFGQLPSSTSNYMTDNDTDITVNDNTYGSSKLGDAAGSWDMTVNGGSFTASNFQVDAIFATAGGTFVQYGSIVGGTIDQTTGAMTLDPTGRLGAIPTTVDNAWNIPSGGTAYAQFITGESTNANGSITGRDIGSNGDGTYNVILVSASNVGDAWGSQFATVPYAETWNVHIAPAPVPIPAAAWLFGSSLIGLVGIARRKKSS
jgi:hypothetical protein